MTIKASVQKDKLAQQTTNSHFKVQQSIELGHSQKKSSKDYGIVITDAIPTQSKQEMAPVVSRSSEDIPETAYQTND
jgi:hypothetical protein